MRWFLPLLIACKREPELSWSVVTAQLPGATAEQIAQTVAAPIERQLGQIKGVETLTSESRSGFAVIAVGTSEDRADAVREAVSSAQRLLPRELLPPMLTRRRGPVVARLAVPVGQGAAVARKLEMLDGVAEVAVCDPGDAPLRYALDVDKTTANGLSPADVFAVASHAPAQPLAAMVKRGITVGDLVTKLPGVPACRARIRGGATALLEVHAQLGAHAAVGDAAAKLGTALPPLVEASGPLDEHADGAFAVIEKTNEAPRVLVEHATQAPIAGAMLELTAADPALLATTGADVAKRLGALATAGMTMVPERTIEIDRDRAARLAVDSSEIAQALALSFDDGLAFTGYPAPELRLVAKGQLLVRSHTTSQLFPVEDFEKIVERPTLREVLHAGQLPAVRIYLRERVDVGALPPGVAATWSRTIEP